MNRDYRPLIILIGAGIFLASAYALAPALAGLVIGCYIIWLGRSA